MKTSTLPAAAASTSPSSSSSPSTDSGLKATKDGLTVGGAIVGCDRVRKAQFPYGFKDHSILGVLEQKIVGNHWILRSEVTITNAYNAKRDAVMSCHVSGNDVAPNVTTFKVTG